LLLALALVCAQLAACWITWSPLTGHFYTSNTAGNDFSEVERNGTTLTYVRQLKVSSNASCIRAFI